jgi:predicted amidophosphoribosyltransferase
VEEPPVQPKVIKEPPVAELPDWKCPKCGEDVPAVIDVCWACGTSADGVEDPTFRRVDEE